MAGLLDDPALLFGLGLIGAPSMGQGIQRGLLGAQQGQQAQMQAQDHAMRRQLMDAQMEEARAQAEQRKALALKSQADAANAARLQQGIASAMTPQIPPGFDMKAPGAQQQSFQRPSGFPPELLALAAQTGKLDELKKLAESGNWGRQEVARVIKGADDKGRPTESQYDKYGGVIGSAIAQPYERKLEDFGGTKQQFDPYMGSLVGQALAKSMTPGETASNQLGWANNAATLRGQNMVDGRAREAATRDQQSVTYLPDASGNMVALPTKLAGGQMPTGRPAVDASGNPIQKQETPVPQHVATAMADNFKAVGVINQALERLKTPAGANATGAKGFLPDFALNRMFPEGTLTRADIGDIESMTVKDRSGATVTAAESPRLKPFIPSIRDDAPTVQKKLARMAQIIDEDTQMLGAFYPKAYKTASEAAKTIKPGTSTNNTTKTGTVTGPTVDELLRKYGG